jgi:hypothetical protein
MRIASMLPVCLPMRPMLGTYLPLRLGQSLSRLDREILIIVHCLVQRIVVASRVLVISLGVAARHTPSEALKLAL